MSGDSPFSPDAIQKAVHANLDSAVAAIPAGHTHAILLDATYSRADGPGGRVLFATKLKSGWNVDSYIGYDKPHGTVAGVDLLRSW